MRIREETKNIVKRQHIFRVCIGASRDKLMWKTNVTAVPALKRLKEMMKRSRYIQIQHSCVSSPSPSPSLCTVHNHKTLNGMEIIIRNDVFFSSFYCGVRCVRVCCLWFAINFSFFLFLDSQNHISVFWLDIAQYNYCVISCFVLTFHVFARFSSFFPIFDARRILSSVV